MCGIVGFLNAQTDYRERQARKAKLEEFMRQGLVVDSIRGMDGTGVARVEKKSLLQPAEVFKKAIPSVDYLQLRGADKILEDCDDVAIMIGHNRFSTRGAFKGDQNAHPFQVDHITLVHNGGITGYHQLTKKNPSDVDSAYIAGAMAEAEPADVLPKLNGSYSLVWHDARDGSLNFARNAERPMTLVKLGENEKDWPGLLFGSEPHMLLWLMVRNGITYHDKFTSTAIHTWYKFLPDQPFSPEKVVYEPRIVGGATHSFQKGRTAGSSAGLPATGETASTGDTTDTRGAATGGSKPLSAKERKWAQRLQKAGLRYGEVVYCKPVEFTPHRNDPHSGTGYFSLPRLQLDVQVHNMRKSAWDQVGTHWGAIRAQTARENKNQPGTHVVIGTWVATAKLHSTAALAPHSRVTGPSGQKINRQFFNELTKDGCIVCNGLVNPEFADDMLWVHGKSPQPVCHECSADGSVRLKLQNESRLVAGRMLN